MMDPHHVLAAADQEIVVAERLLQVARVAVLLGVGRSTVYRWIESGVIVAVRYPGPIYRIPVSEIVRLRAENKPSQISQ